MKSEFRRPSSGGTYAIGDGNRLLTLDLTHRPKEIGKLGGIRESGASMLRARQIIISRTISVEPKDV